MPRLHRHQEIDDWDELAADILDKYEAWAHPTDIDNALGEAYVHGDMTAQEVDQCRTDYLNED